MPGGDCSGSQERRPCCRRRGGGGGALVEPAALAALLFSGGYGYDMRRTILDMTDGEVDVDVGGLYRALRRLEESGAVASRWGEEGSGPRRREYELTEDGIDLAEQWLEALRARRRLDELLVGLLERGLGEWSASGPDEDRDASGNKEPLGGSVDSGEDPSREERSK